MLATLSHWITYDLCGITAGSLAGSALEFFIYDTIKIFLLLAVIIYIISFARTFFPPERTRRLLGGKKGITGYILAAALGIITPFCSCSAVPLFIGFIRAGVPLGVTFAFLVSSPMINEIALVMLFGLFGWKIALLYVISGLVIAVVSGFIIGKLRVENLVSDFVLSGRSAEGLIAEFSFRDRLAIAADSVKDIIRKVWPYIIIGIAIGAWIHGYVPADLLARWAGRDKWYAVPLATLLGIPLYSNAAGVMPLVAALVEKGVSMGTSLAFMMAVTALSLPEFVILKTVMRPKLIGIFAGIVGLGIIFTGYLFNMVLP